MRVLIVKLSSLGDVVHAMPVVHDLRRARPGVQVDWVVEPGFAPLVRRVQGVHEVIECAQRRWRKAWWTSAVRAEWRAFRTRLAAESYDAVIDLQGLTKSALVARLARGRSFGLAHRTDGSSFEWPARWLVDQPIAVEPHVHAVDRSRRLAAAALGFELEGPPRYGLQARPSDAPHPGPTVVFVHGTSREDKLWPVCDWIELGRRCLAAGWSVVLPQAGEAEALRAQAIAGALGPRAQVWPALGLDAVVDRMGAAQAVVGVDSGLSHIAVALDLPHVQLYNFPTAWRTGPQASHGHRHQVSLEGTPVPSLQAVWDAWLAVTGQAVPA